MSSRQRKYVRDRKRWREANGISERAGRTIGVPTVCESRPSAITLIRQGYREVKGWNTKVNSYRTDRAIAALCSEWGRA